jgi:predicted CxxxxCH...CXXCH cytochrome family protein
MTQNVQIGGTTYCHFTAGPVDTYPVKCISCHGNPPDGATGASPNQAFRHTAHFSTTNNLVGITCGACHAGFGTGTATHATNVALASTAVDPKFNENGLTATYTPGAGTAGTQICTNVSCHGGKVLTATVAPLGNVLWKGVGATPQFDQTTCTKCHLVLTQPSSNVSPSSFSATLAYIGPISGDPIPPIDPVNGTFNLHKLHASVVTGQPYSTKPWLLCVDCHALPIAGHYSKIMNGKRQLALEPDIAAGTIGGLGTRVTSYTRRATVTGQSSCIAGYLSDGTPTGNSTTPCHTVISGPTVPRSWYNN